MGLYNKKSKFEFFYRRAAVSKIVVETCDAVYEALAPIYLRSPNTKEEWREISDQYTEILNMPHVSVCFRRQTYCYGLPQRFRKPRL